MHNAPVEHPELPVEFFVIQSLPLSLFLKEKMMEKGKSEMEEEKKTSLGVSL